MSSEALALVASRTRSVRGVGTRARLREGLSAGSWVVVCSGVLCSAVSVGRLSSVLACKLRLVMPRWAGLMETLGTTGAATSAGMELSVELASLPGCPTDETETGRKICTTTWLITRCTGQNRFTNHSSTKCAKNTANQTSRRERDAGSWAWNSLAMCESVGAMFS